MNAEQQQQQQQQQQHAQTQQQSPHQQQHEHEQQHQQHQQHQQQQQQQYQQRTHHVYCSYEKDVVCDTNEPQQQQQQQQQHHSNMPHHTEPPATASEEPHIYCHAHSSATTPTHHRHAHNVPQQARKHSHSHSPHRSRHTSPHSQHSHSLHSSPHQAHTMHRPGAAVDGSAQQQQQQQQPHPTHHHHHRRRRRHHPPLTHQHSGGSGGSAGRHMTGGHGGGHGAAHRCTRRHRSTTDVSNVSINTCHDPTCVDREVQEIFVRKKCCATSSRTELAQYFAEDLYGTGAGSASRRPSSCCTSSDYCYQTDSTSLYGSRSSLSRNNSIKSAAALSRKRRSQQRAAASYMSVSLCGLNDGVGGGAGGTARCHRGSLSSVFDRTKRPGTAMERGSGGAKPLMSPRKASSLMRRSSRDALSQELPDYACSPSPIRWSFLADGKSPTEFEGGADSTDDLCKGATWSGASGGAKGRAEAKYSYREHTRRERERERERDRDRDRDRDRGDHRGAHRGKWRDQSPDEYRNVEFEKSTTVLFHHQEGDPYNDCCGSGGGGGIGANYIQCNTYLDQDLQITSEDIHQYLSKGQHVGGGGIGGAASDDVLNNSKNYPFQPSNALEFQYKNNFSSSRQQHRAAAATTSSEGGDSLCRGYDSGGGYFRRNSSKETNLNQNACGGARGGAVASSGGCTMDESSTSCSTPLSPTNINLSSSTNNINIVFNGGAAAAHASEVKFINTAREPAVSYEAHHSGYLPYTFPTYDYTNMSANSLLFDKPLGIDQLPKEFAAATSAAAASASRDAHGVVQKKNSITSQHSSLLQSPVQSGGAGAGGGGGCDANSSFESFDAASNHQLLSQRNSCQFSTPRTPLSPNSPAASSLGCMSAGAAAINPAAAAGLYPHGQASPHYGYQPHRHRHAHSSAATASAQHHHHHAATADGFKFGNALRRVRRRARKYTEFLRKK